MSIMSPWKYIGWAFVAAAWGSLVYLNLNCAIEQDSLVKQVALGVGLFIVDLGAIAFMLGVFEEHSLGRPARAVACATLWVACSLGEGVGAYSALMDYTNAESAPAALAEEQRQVSVRELAQEQANLIEVRRQFADARRESQREDLHRRERESLARIEALTPKTLAASVMKSHSRFSGREAVIVFALWFLSQVAVFSLTGRAHGSPEMLSVSEPVGVSLRRPAARRSTVGWVDAPMIEATQPSVTAQLGASESGLELEPSTAQETTQPNPGNLGDPEPNPTQPNDPKQPSPDDNPDGPGGGGKSVVLVEKNAQPNPTQRPKTAQPRPRLSVVGGQPKSLGRSSPEIGSFERQVANMNRAGLSERVIAEKLKVGRGKVRTVINKLKETSAMEAAGGSPDAV